tara:strand:- start:121 stop:582 length:462 start_codon:yes stop_codon:yes gene_type:complete
MTEEQELNSEANEDKNWKAMREENKSLKEKLEGFEAKEKVSVFKDAGLDTTQGIGKAISQVYSGDLEVEAIKSFAAEEYGVTIEADVGQQDGIREQVQDSQNKLSNINKNSVVDSFSNDDLLDAIKKSEEQGDIRNSMRLKLAAMEEEKNSKN